MKHIFLVLSVFSLVVGVAAWAQTHSGKDAPKGQAASSKTNSGTQGAKPATASTKAADANATTVNGWISDSKCGAKGANAGAEACTKRCMAAGATAVLVNDADGKVWSIDNPDSIMGHEGHHVTVTGHLDTAKTFIHIASMKMMAAASTAKPKS